MKKTYITPQAKVHTFDTKHQILAGSPYPETINFNVTGEGEGEEITSKEEFI